MKDVDWKAVAMGAVVAIAVGVLASVVAAVIDLPKDSNGWYIFFWVDVIGAGIGGFIAGRRRLDAPLIHGALVGACAYVVIAIFATTITLVSGNAAPAVAQVLFAILWLALGGTIGGWVASWRAQRARPGQSSP
jgi:putative membrane protein (TIGR04086 family)